MVGMGSCVSCARLEQREKDLESRPPLTVASSRLRRPQPASFGRCWAQSALPRLPTATSFLCHQRVGLCFQRPVGSTGHTKKKKPAPSTPEPSASRIPGWISVFSLVGRNTCVALGRSPSLGVTQPLPPALPGVGRVVKTPPLLPSPRVQSEPDEDGDACQVRGEAPIATGTGGLPRGRPTREAASCRNLEDCSAGGPHHLCT